MSHRAPEAVPKASSILFADQVGAHEDEIELHFLPAYAPHLSPGELVNANRAQMERAVRACFHRAQELPAHVLGCFQAPHTKYASSTI